MKRKWDHEDDGNPTSISKKIRHDFRLNLLELSDEILLRILTNLSIHELTLVERVSQRLQQLATDHEIWKSKFYDNWIAPRARRIPATLSLKQQEIKRHPKLAKWLEYGHLLRAEVIVNWKRQYKIRRNWAVGFAKVYEIEIATPPSPPVLATVHNGIVFTADSKAGLRAWSNTGDFNKLYAQHDLYDCSPSSIAVETKSNITNIVIGFQKGKFAIYEFADKSNFILRTEFQTASKGTLSSVAIAVPYIATMSASKEITLHELWNEANRMSGSSEVKLIANLHSEASYAHAALVLRKVPGSIIATVAYAFSRLNAGWCVGLQEIRLASTGRVVDSQLASSIDTPNEAHYRSRSQWGMSSRSAATLPFVLHPQLMKPPTSISYQHPYLLVSLSDNTLMSYAVTSTENKLEISTGRRLWGHTSEVSGAEVSNRGKAVSISSKGNEIRVWELEDLLTTFNRQGNSTQVKPIQHITELTASIARRGCGLGLALREIRRESALTRHWVGFDDEQVVVLGEREAKQIMSYYDFT